MGSPKPNLNHETGILTSQSKIHTGFSVLLKCIKKRKQGQNIRHLAVHMEEEDTQLSIIIIQMAGITIR